MCLQRIGMPSLLLPREELKRIDVAGLDALKARAAETRALIDALDPEGREMLRKVLEKLG